MTPSGPPDSTSQTPAPPTPPGAALPTGTGPDRSVDRALVRGIAWTGSMKWATQFITWAGMIVLARLLTPEDYGLVGMATIYLGFITIITEFGLGASIITIRTLSPHQVSQLNTVALLLGLLGAAVTAASAIPLGAFFRAPELPWVAVALSSTFIIASFKIVPTALLQKALRFRALALIDAGFAVLFTAANIGFALLGYRYWALVLGGIVANVAAALVLNLYAPHGYAWPRRRDLGAAMRFSNDVLIGRIAWYFYSNADFATAGRMLGKGLLGAYTFAWTIASMPVEKVTSLVTRVTPAVFARLQDDLPALRRMICNVTEGLALLTLPASLGIAVVADDLVTVALGPGWEAAIAPLRLLALYASLRSVVTILPQALMALHDTRWLKWHGIATTLALPAGFIIGARWGAVGIAMGWITVYPLTVIPLYWRTFRKTGLGAGEYFRAVWPALRGSLVMAGAVVLVNQGITGVVSRPVSLFVQVAAGVLVFGLVGFLPARERITGLFRILRSQPAAAA